MESEKQVVTADDVGTINAAALAAPTVDPAAVQAAQDKVTALEKELQTLETAHKESKDRVNAKKDELRAAQHELKKLKSGK